MTHEEANLRTKEMLAGSLKKLMAKKPLKKITVSDIVTDCNLNRKTFYYHFEDIYALIKWTLEQEAIDVVKNLDVIGKPDEVLTFVVNYVNENSHILNCAYDSIGRDELKRFFYNDFSSIVGDAITRCEKQNEIHISDGFREFLTCFFTEAIAGMLVNSFKMKEDIDIEAVTSYVRAIVLSLPDILYHGIAIESAK